MALLKLFLSFSRAVHVFVIPFAEDKKTFVSVISTTIWFRPRVLINFCDQLSQHSLHGQFLVSHVGISFTMNLE